MPSGGEAKIGAINFRLEPRLASILALTVGALHCSYSGVVYQL